MTMNFEYIRVRFQKAEPTNRTASKRRSPEEPAILEDHPQPLLSSVIDRL